jgi:hypothetical protein
MERELLVQATRRAYEFAAERDQALARLVVNEFAAAQKRGKRG